MSLTAEHVSFKYDARREAAGAFALHDVSVAVQRGSLTGLLGPNGCGKTTLLRLMAGVLQPDQGAVTLNGRPLRGIPRRELARHVAVVPQETHPAFDYSVLEMALMGRHPHLGVFQLEGPEDIAIAQESLAATGTAHLASRPYATLSGGEKQRVVIAGALAQSPDVLLLDEPTASLDLAYQLEVASLLSRLNRDRGVTMVLATHDLNLAASLCDSLVPAARRPRARPGSHARCAHRRARPAAVQRRSRRPLSRRGGTPDGRPDPARAMTVSESTLPRVAAQPRPIRARLAMTLAAYGGLAVATCLLAPLVGSTPISLSRVFDRSIPFADNVDAQIFFVARMPRVLAGAVVGAALASAGVVLQALLRNPLATPFTLGVSAGAALGAILAISFGAAVTLGPFSPVPLASLAGAFLAATVVYAMATRPGRAMSTSVLLLAGVTLNSFFSALILFVQYMADFTEAYRTLRWMMGDLDVGSFEPILGALPLIAGAFLIFAALPSSLNLLSVGSDIAATRGVDVARTQRLAFISSALATSAAVSLAGPIGFVGIVVPHLVRLLTGVDHRIVLPASALFGASFLVACDLVARTVLAPVEVPVGIVTAMLGGPFFLWLLLRRG